MSEPAIIVENLSKCYIIGHQRSKDDGFRHVVEDALRAPLQWFRSRHEQKKRQQEEFWALNGMSFEIKQGEVVGIIGRNGAGKSTLLKVLSRITEPTKGRIQIDGRVASLLEVGTGFHADLTGRENIFLNGAILGMRQAEIKKKFDEIVAFSEVEKFLDTPVKRYSSGMYVRLAFAVAAHLEPEILIVDEVLAVGDSEFQKKCIGKMHSVAEQFGRTVLFVSHNMAAITSLTSRCLVLSSGKVIFDGSPSDSIKAYIESSGDKRSGANNRPTGRGAHSAILKAALIDASSGEISEYVPGTPFRLSIVFETDGSQGLSIEAFLVDANRSRLSIASTYQFHGKTLPQQKGVYECVLELEPLWLASGRYTFDVTTSMINQGWDHYVDSAVEFSVVFCNPLGTTLDLQQSLGFGPLAHICKSPISFDAVSPLQLGQMGLASVG